MKPDWKDAPEWAKFLAMDAGGVWCWHETLPVKSKYGNVWYSTGKIEACHLSLPSHWQEAVEPRP